MLQQHSSLKTIKKKLVRKALDMIRRIVDEDPDEKFEEQESSKLMNSLSQISAPYS
jgi:heat shock protein beta